MKHPSADLTLSQRLAALGAKWDADVPFDAADRAEAAAAMLAASRVLAPRIVPDAPEEERLDARVARVAGSDFLPWFKDLVRDLDASRRTWREAALVEPAEPGARRRYAVLYCDNNPRPDAPEGYESGRYHAFSRFDDVRRTALAGAANGYEIHVYALAGIARNIGAPAPETVRLGREGEDNSDCARWEDVPALPAVPAGACPLHPLNAAVEPSGACTCPPAADRPVLPALPREVAALYGDPAPHRPGDDVECPNCLHGRIGCRGTCDFCRGSGRRKWTTVDAAMARHATCVLRHRPGHGHAQDRCVYADGTHDPGVAPADALRALVGAAGSHGRMYGLATATVGGRTAVHFFPPPAKA